MAVGFSQTAAGIIYASADGTTLNVPTLPGVTASLADDKVTYTALAANSYGLKADEYAGEFSPFVSVGGQPVGGVTLIPAVVTKLLDDSLAAIPAQSDKYVAALPLDARTATAATALNITYSVGYDTYQIPIVLISFTGDLPLTNILPTTKQVEVLKNTYAGWIYDWELRSYAPNLPKIVPGREEFYLTVGGPFEGFTTSQTDVNASFGATICNTTGPVSIGEMAATEWRDMTPDHVLTVPGSNVPVFVAGG